MTSTAAPQVTIGPIRGSHKHHLDGPDGLRVPVRRVELSNGEHHDAYDTSGPYTDEHAHIDVRAGLPRLREPWIAGREHRTQLEWARAGVVTREMRFVAIRECVDVELVRSEVARGRAVIPANRRHPETEPMIIGKRSS